MRKITEYEVGSTVKGELSLDLGLLVCVCFSLGVGSMHQQDFIPRWGHACFVILGLFFE